MNARQQLRFLQLGLFERLIGEIDRELHLHVRRKLNNAGRRSLAELQRLPDPPQPAINRAIQPRELASHT